MTDRPSPADLAEAEHWLRSRRLQENVGPSTRDALKLLLSEYDRLRAVERAAAELLDEHDSPAPDYTMRKVLRDRLRALLNGEAP